MLDQLSVLKEYFEPFFVLVCMIIELLELNLFPRVLNCHSSISLF
jgi:hypothetical protein